MTSEYIATLTRSHGQATLVVRARPAGAANPGPGVDLVDYQVSDGEDPGEVLYAAGWRARHLSFDLCDSEYAEVLVDPADWPTIVADATRHKEAADAEAARREDAWRAVIRGAMFDPASPKAAVVAATGKSSARVYQVRDGKR